MIGNYEFEKVKCTTEEHVSSINTGIKIDDFEIKGNLYTAAEKIPTVKTKLKIESIEYGKLLRKTEDYVSNTYTGGSSGVTYQKVWN